MQLLLIAPSLVLSQSNPSNTTQRRIALVIGNSAYKFSPLVNPGNDARAIAAALRESGFTVIEKHNLGQAVMRQTIREFGNELLKGGVGLFYYAGHGVQLRGRNYLIPVGADIQQQDEIEDQSVDINLVLQKFGSAKNALNILILDACRNNPFADSFGSLPAGLAPIDAPPSTFIAFSTAPGYTAADGVGDNSIYTQSLVDAMREPGVKLEEVFKIVRAKVRRATNDRQVPWENTSLDTDFYFKGPDVSKLAAQQQERDKAAEDIIERAVMAVLKKREAELAAAQAAKIEQETRAARASIERLTKELAELSATPPKEVERVAPRPQQAALTTTRPIPRSEVEPASVPQQIALAAPSIPRPQPIINVGGRVERPDIRVGDQWKYQVTDNYTGSKKTIAVEVVRVNDNYIYTQSGQTAVAALDSAPTGGALDVWDRNWNLLRQGDIEYVPFYPTMQFPMEPGKSWSGSVIFDVGVSVKLNHDLKAVVVGWERVTVPAGTFDAVKLSLQGTYHVLSVGQGGTGGIIDTIWYAPAIRQIIKKEIQQRGFGPSGSTLTTNAAHLYAQLERWELVGYKLD